MFFYLYLYLYFNKFMLIHLKTLVIKLGVLNGIEIKLASSPAAADTTATAAAALLLSFSSQVEKDAWVHRLPNIRRVLRLPLQF